MAQVTGTAKIALVECYLTEEDPPEDHDFARYGAVCGRCFGALSDLEREARNAADQMQLRIATITTRAETAERERDALRAFRAAVIDAVRAYDDERLAHIPPDAARGLALFHAIEEALSKTRDQ